MKDALIILVPHECSPDDMRTKLIAALAFSNGSKDSRWGELAGNVHDAEVVQVMDKADGPAVICRKVHCEQRV